MIEFSRHIILFFFLCCAQLLLGQYAIRGEIVDEQTGALIPQCEIFISNNFQSVESDGVGAFQFVNLDSGLLSLKVFSYDYNVREVEINLQADTSIIIRLTPLTEQLTEVMIRARKAELFSIKSLQEVEGTAIYAGKKSEVVLMELMMGNLANNNARQIYAQIAGLNIYEGNSGGLQLNIGGRGLDPNRSSNFNTRQNSYDISADVLGYPESYYSPPADAIEQIQIIRGAASLQYGTQFGGLVNFILHKPPRYKKIELTSKQSIGSYGLFNSFNSVGGKIGDKISYYTYYNYKTGDGYRNFSGFDAHNLYFHLDYQLGKQTNLSAEMTYFTYLSQQAGGLTDEQFIADPRMSTRERNWFEVDWKLYNMQLEHKFSEQGDFSLSLFALDAKRNTVGFRGNPVQLNENPITALDEQDANGNFILPRDVIRGTFNNWGVETRFLQRYKFINRNAVFLIGAKYYHADNTSIQGPGSTGLDANFNTFTSDFPDYANQSVFDFPNRNLSLFGEHIFYLTDKFSLTPGFRLENIKTESNGDYNTVVYDNAGNPISNIRLEDKRSLSRRFLLLGLGASYKPREQTEIYANVSQNYRSVTFSDIRVVNPTFIIDPSIADERGLTMDIGIRGRWKKHISFDMGVYSVLYNDRIGIILDDRANRVRKNIGNAFIAGVESYVEFNLDRMVSDNRDYKWSWFVNSAFTYSEYLSSEDNNVVGKKLEFIPQANLKTGIKLGYKNILLSGQYSYLSSQFTDVQNSTVPDAGDVRSGVIGEIPAYRVVDFSMSYQRKWYSVETGINNLLNEAYFTRRATGYPGPGIIPSDGRSFYLTLGVKL